MVKLGRYSLLSSQYKLHASASCFWLLRHWTDIALSFARLSDGNNNEARIAMMAMTTNNSINVKPRRALRRQNGSFREINIFGF